MIKSFFFKHAFPFFVFICVSGLTTAYAQVNPRNTNTVFLQQNGIDLLQKTTAERTLAFLRAKERGWPTLRTRRDGSIIALQKLDAQGLPVYYITYNNAISAATTGTNQLYTGGSLGLSLNGSSILGAKVAIWDGGAVLTNHTEFATNRVEIKDKTTATSEHSTHVAGTIMAAGINPAAKGMAFALPKLYSFDFTDDSPEMSANAAGLLISNHSYGTIAGWDYNTDVSPARWEFYGNPNATEDYKFGYYDSDANEWDKICYNAPYYLPVKSAGNNRSVNGPAVGQPYYRYNTAGTMINAGNRPAGISSNDGYGIISTNGNAKNILTIGAVNPIPSGPGNSSAITMTSFSSWGPTDDGRIKPDLVGNGINVTSTSNESVYAYTTLSGTSMAAPNISGSLILLQELYSQKNSGTYLRASTLKGLAIGTATDAGNPGPDYIYGWGLLNTEAAARLILNNGTKSRIAEKVLTQGETQDLQVVASGNGPLIATICWTDPEATPVSEANALNNSTLRLVNDLDLRVIQGTSILSPWVLNPASPSAAATTGDNFRDNTEQVYIPDAVPGRPYTIRVTHKGTLQRAPQGYSLIVSGIGGTSYCSSAPASTADSKITNFTLNNINNTPTTNCTGYSDFTSQTIMLEKGKSYPMSLSVGTCSTNFNKVAKVYADWNGDGDFDDSEELMATSPVIPGNGNFTATITVPGNVTTNYFSLLRVVLTETSDPASVLPCGTYAKGETQDYRVKFLMPALDAGIKGFVNPTATVCASSTQGVKITLKNYGTQSISTLPVSVTVSQNGTLLTTLTGTYTGTLASLEETDFLVPGTFNAEAGKGYSLTATVSLANDADLSNNQLTTAVQVNIPPVAAAESKAYFCNSFNSYALSSPGEGTVYWYKSASAVLPFAYGNSVTTTEAPEGTAYYAGVNDYRSDVGPKNKADVADGGYNQFTPAVIVSTAAPVILESAKLYIGHSGKIKFTVLNGLGVETSSVILNVTATRTTPGDGALANDPNDNGQTYPLNLVFPAAGNYTISIEYFDGATIFRNNAGNTKYPYTSALALFNIVSNTATAPSDPVNFYYYLYDMKVKAMGCTSTSRLEVPLTTSEITKIGGTLTVSAIGSYQWYLNGVVIAGATAQTYTPVQNGKYTVDVTIAGGCSLRSGSFTFTDIMVDPAEMDINLKVYPVPTDGELNVSFNIPLESDVSLIITNMLGQQVYKESKNNYLGLYTTKIQMGVFGNGLYILTVKSGNKKFSRKITLFK